MRHPETTGSSALGVGQVAVVHVERVAGGDVRRDGVRDRDGRDLLGAGLVGAVGLTLRACAMCDALLFRMQGWTCMHCWPEGSMGT